MITIKDIADNNTSISSTRWAFASIVKFDITVIAITIISYIVGHFIGNPFSYDLIKGVALLLGVLTTIIATSKTLQGFEPKKKEENTEEENTEEENTEEEIIDEGK